jgi:hypothetical protein
MKKLVSTIMVIFVAVMFVSVAVAACSNPCGCKKPCSPCAKPCAKPCVKPCSPCAKPCSPCAKPCDPCRQEFVRNVIGQKVPIATYKAGDAYTDTATKYEPTLISGVE